MKTGSREAETVMRRLVGADESLLWSGVPRQGLFLQLRDLWMIPLGLVWGGFAFFWEYRAVQSLRESGGPEAVGMVLFGIPFVLTGLYLVVGRFFHDAWRRRHTWYGLTDKRAIIVSGGMRRKVISLPRAAMVEVTLTRHGDGRGTLVFGRDAPLRMVGGRYIRGPRVPRFERVENAEWLYRQIMGG